MYFLQTLKQRNSVHEDARHSWEWRSGSRVPNWKQKDLKKKKAKHTHGWDIHLNPVLLLSSQALLARLRSSAGGCKVLLWGNWPAYEKDSQWCMEVPQPSEGRPVTKPVFEAPRSFNQLFSVSLLNINRQPKYRQLKKARDYNKQEWGRIWELIVRIKSAKQCLKSKS